MTITNGQLLIVDDEPINIEILVDIFEDDVIFESVGERWLLSIGEPLADATALPPEF